MEAEERIFLNATNIVIVAGAAVGSIVFGNFTNILPKYFNLMSNTQAIGLLMVIVVVFSYLTLRYFADRQKAVAYAARKIVVLRRMLGMDYGDIGLVMPNWRIEGANQPFAIKLFPGWNTYVSYPFYLIATVSSALLFELSQQLSKLINEELTDYKVLELKTAIIFCSIWVWLIRRAYRKALFDKHERWSLHRGFMASKLLLIKVRKNVEYIIYRAKLSTFEIKRMRIDISRLRILLVEVEDKDFFEHRGISYRGLIRALLGVLRLKRKSGGSTITQQVVRTLFIERLEPLLNRKIVEIFLAKWFHRVIDKNEEIEIYLASVRFEKRIFGIIAAMKHFFGKIIRRPSMAQSFFLIERISNIRSLLLTEKIDQTLKRLIESKMMTEKDAIESISLYESAVLEGKILDQNGNGIIRLKNAWQSTSPSP